MKGRCQNCALLRRSGRKLSISKDGEVFHLEAKNLYEALGEWYCKYSFFGQTPTDWGCDKWKKFNGKHWI